DRGELRQGDGCDRPVDCPLRALLGSSWRPGRTPALRTRGAIAFRGNDSLAPPQAYRRAVGWGIIASRRERVGRVRSEGVVGVKGTANSPACRRRWVAAGLLLAGATAAGYLGVTAWADFHASAAVEALDQLRFEDARWHAERCLAVRPGDLDARLLAARAARRAGDRGAAGRHLDECKRRGELTPALGLEY